jgi:hypothetical protein
VSPDLLARIDETAESERARRRGCTASRADVVRQLLEVALAADRDPLA